MRLDSGFLFQKYLSRICNLFNIQHLRYLLAEFKHIHFQYFFLIHGLTISSFYRSKKAVCHNVPLNELLWLKIFSFLCLIGAVFESLIYFLFRNNINFAIFNLFAGIILYILL